MSGVIKKMGITTCLSIHPNVHKLFNDYMHEKNISQGKLLNGFIWALLNGDISIESTGGRKNCRKNIVGVDEPFSSYINVNFYDSEGKMLKKYDKERLEVDFA